MKTRPFLIRVLICFVLSLIPFKDAEDYLYSIRMRVRGKQPSAPKNVLLIRWDTRDFQLLKNKIHPEAKDIDALKNLFFWDPWVMDQTLRDLLVKKPKAILMTWHIPEEIVGQPPRHLEHSAFNDPRVIWPGQFQSDGKYITPPKALHRETTQLSGFLNLFADKDGQVRRSIWRKDGHPSLIAQAFQVVHPGHPAPLRTVDNPFFINFVGKPGSIPECHLHQLWEGATTPCPYSLEDRLVLISKESSNRASESSFGSLVYKTPFGEMPRADILANEIHTLVNGKKIHQASWFALALVMVAMIFLAAFYIIYYPVVLSAIAVVGTGILFVILFSQFLFSIFGIYFPSFHVTNSLLVTYLVFTGYRLAFQENLQWRSLKQAQYLRELDQMKTNFLSLISHDLKTPIAKIQAVVERLRRESVLPPEDRSDPRELFDSIENSNNELKRYIDSLLNLSKIESQKVILNKRSADLNRVIEAVLKRLRPLAAHKNIEIQEALEPLFAFEFDEDLIRQVLTNLVDNAIKYSPEHSLVTVRSRELDGNVQVEVEDQGPGIPQDQLPLMFRKFSRFLRPMGEQVKGTGLGLYLSKYFIEMHGGKIAVKSHVGKGTVFSFTLPLQGSEEGTLLG